ncbi:MAG: hypothetical protein Q4F49_05880 [Pseudoxanthomonas suwonensis]|nr:hypothetical protein [Pseudoxanthomonas suwonensis]
MEQLQAGNPSRAMRFFERGAWHADKPSQAMIASLYWEGRGVPQDRALGYVWMDLAAERGYPDFLLQRERYWDALEEQERSNAMVQGERIYARYGDEVAVPRIEALLRRGRQRVVGSRTGFSGNARILVPGPGVSDSAANAANPLTIDGSNFYDPTFWVPEKYRAWHDKMWSVPRMWRVDIGELEDVQPASRVRGQRRPGSRRDGDQ